MDSFHSFPKVFTLGHGAIRELLDGDVVVQEKVDGSQFSFGKDPEGNLHVRSRGRVFDINGPDNMFQIAAERVKALAGSLAPGWTYRGEYLNKPKHNALQYDRVPINNIILFDVTIGHHAYASMELLQAEAFNLDMEAVPVLWQGPGHLLTPQRLGELMQRQSVLGGMMEGVVVKNYAKYSADGHVMMGKFVSDMFKEIHKREWTKDNPAKKDIAALLTEQYRTDARWLKGVQHLQEAGLLKCGPEDIGPLMKEIRKDVEAECVEEIKQQLWSFFRKNFLDSICRGLPEWYKQRLLDGQFSKE